MVTRVIRIPARARRARSMNSDGVPGAGTPTVVPARSSRVRRVSCLATGTRSATAGVAVSPKTSRGGAPAGVPSVSAASSDVAARCAWPRARASAAEVSARVGSRVTASFSSEKYPSAWATQSGRYSGAVAGPAVAIVSVACRSTSQGITWTRRSLRHRREAHRLRWRPRLRAQRAGSTPRARPSGAAVCLDLLEQPANAPASCREWLISGGGRLEDEPGDALRGVGDGQAPCPLAHRAQRRAIRQEPLHGFQQPVRGQRDLGEENGAAGGLDQARIGGLLVAAGAGQGDVDRGLAEVEALVDGAGAAPSDDQVSGRIDVTQLGAHVGDQRVASPEGLGQSPSAAREPGAVSGPRVVATLMDDLAIGQQGGQDLAHGPVDLVRALGAAGDVDDRQGAVQRELPAGGLARSAQQLGSQR